MSNQIYGSCSFSCSRRIKKKSSGLKPEPESVQPETKEVSDKPPISSEPTAVPLAEESKEEPIEPTSETPVVEVAKEEPENVESSEKKPDDKEAEEKTLKKLSKVSAHYKITKIPRINTANEPEEEINTAETNENKEEISTENVTESENNEIELLDTNEENVTILWERFTTEQLKPERISLITLLKAIKPTIQEGNLLATMQSEQQVQLFEKVRTIVFGFINKHLKTKLIASITSIDDSVQLGNSNPYTDGEILEHFIEKNPAVKDAVKQLGLRIK